MVYLVSITMITICSAASFDHGCDSVGQSCSDICLTNVATSIFTCACPTGLSLLDDETTCKTCEYILVLNSVLRLWSHESAALPKGGTSL